MPKPKKGPRLGGSAAHQRHIIANLCKDLIRYRSVRTTEAKAKTVQPYMDRLITKAKKGDTHNRREVLKVVQDREIAYILMEELAPLFEGREGGYTRIVPVGNRKGDNAPMAVISLVTEPVQKKEKKADKVATPVKAVVADTPDEVAESAESPEEVVDEAVEAVEAAALVENDEADVVEEDASTESAPSASSADEADEADEADDDEADEAEDEDDDDDKGVQA